MNAYGYTKEEQDKASTGFINDYRDAAALCGIIRQIVIKFDNKVFNCRLEKAIQEKARVFVRKERKYIEIYMYGKMRNHYMSIATLPIEKALPDGKRIDAAAFCEALADAREKRLKDAYALENAMHDIDIYKAQINALKGQIKALKDALPYMAREIYDIN